MFSRILFYNKQLEEVIFSFDKPDFKTKVTKKSYNIAFLLMDYINNGLMLFFLFCPIIMNELSEFIISRTICITAM
jgi:hypothetical protein